MGVLSRSSIISAAKRRRQQSNQPNKQTQQQPSSRSKEPMTLSFMAGVIKEATFRQTRIKESLERELQKCEGVNATITTSQGKNQEKEKQDGVTKQDKLIAKTQQRKEVTMERLGDVQKSLNHLDQLENQLNQSTLAATHQTLLKMGFAKLFELDPYHDWKWLKAEQQQSPPDFGGLTFTSPLGVPILVGKQGAHGDSALRRIAQGADLWFQVADYRGSRVLLRSSSLSNGRFRDSKSCRAMAADLAAYYSDWRHAHDPHNTQVPVMYTDSKHVAKRGSKAGQMRKHKALGKLMGRPMEVAELAEGMEP